MIDRVEEKFGYPVIVKPVNLGSSVGISVAKNKTELEKSIDDAYTYATRILVEPAIMNLREINCAVLGDENEAEASECEEPLHSDEILSYDGVPREWPACPEKYQRNCHRISGKKFAIWR